MAVDAEVPYQALYRRFRPQRFTDVLGQDHVTRALRAAVRDGKVAHAYLFSGPRGTGKTSTARILAMALNCEQPQDGEPCGVCGSCVAIRTGASLDVQELDSATNRGIDEMRDLLSRVALGTPGRWKVYIVDEVHQITPAAASALLKTLEEPPGHVIFVLATTDPQKVLDTIRSRTQHFEFRLLPSDVLSGLLADVARRADIDLPPEAIDVVVRRGHGSARDALSALDQVAAAGTVDDDASVVTDLVDSIIERDAAGVLVNVAEAAAAGLDPRRLGGDLIEHLRNGFLATRAPSLVLLSEAATEAVHEQASRMGPAALVRAMELIGQALIDMRDAADPRTTLEVTLVRLAAPEVDDSRSALLERVERLERAIAGGAPGPVRSDEVREASSRSPGVSAPAASRPSHPPAPSDPPASAAPSAPAAAPYPSPSADTAPAATAGPPDRPHRTTGAGGRPMRSSAGSPAAAPSDGFGAAPPLPGRADPPRVERTAAPAPPLAGPAGPPGAERTAAPTEAPQVASVSGPASAADGGPSVAPSREELTVAWGDLILPALRPAVKVYVATGRFLPSEGAAAVYAVPDRGLLSRAEANRPEVEAALSRHFGRPVRLRLVLDRDGPARGDAASGDAAAGATPGGPPPDPVEDEAAYDWTELDEAPATVSSPEQRLLDAFPGAEEVQP